MAEGVSTETYAQVISAIADSITALASVALLVGLWIAYGQLKAARDQILAARDEIRANHSQAQRALAVELIGRWAASLSKQSSAARKLVETFDDELCRDLYAQRPFQIRKEKVELLSTSLEEKIQSNGEVYKLTQSQTTELRWRIVRYLNTLESILSAWRHHAADRKMIEEQFAYLVRAEQGHKILEKFRTASGGKNTFPSIEDFAEKMNVESRKLSDGHPPIVGSSGGT